MTYSDMGHRTFILILLWLSPLALGWLVYWCRVEKLGKRRAMLLSLFIICLLWLLFVLFRFY
jgi:hypothetical protein